MVDILFIEPEQAILPSSSVIEINTDIDAGNVAIIDRDTMTILFLFKPINASHLVRIPIIYAQKNSIIILATSKDLTYNAIAIDGVKAEV